MSNAEGTLHMLHTSLTKVMPKYGYNDLTEVQRRSIPAVLTGRDVLIVAPTGSGKTEAALFPLISKFLSKPHEHKPISLIYITPLRALNRDLMKRLVGICSDLGISVQVRHGDTPQRLRKSIERNPPHILITTPETFQYLLISAQLRDYLANTKYLIIDELHELVSSKRGAELIASLSRFELISNKVQRIGISASIGNVSLAKKFLSYGRPVSEVVILSNRDMDIELLTPYSSGKLIDRIELIKDLIKSHGQVIVFTNTRDEAELLGLKLKELGVNIYVHHGSLSKDEREVVEEKLKRGEIKGVVSTSSLELGIDVGGVDAVIQSSSPRQVVKLVQRVGRSMHKVGLRAKGYVVADMSVDDILESLVIIRRALSNELEGFSIHEGSLDVLTHQVVGLLLQEGSMDAKAAYEVLRKSYVFKDLTFEEFAKVLELISELHLIKFDGLTIKPTGRGRIYYLTTTMIVDSPHYSVVDLLSMTSIGHLDEEFVALEISEGSSLVLGGRLWHVISVDEEDMKVYVEEASSKEYLIPSWVGETIPVDYKVAREACSLRKLLALNYLPKHYVDLISEGSLTYLREVISKHVSRGYPLPSENLLLVEVKRSSPSFIVVHVCLGSRGNRGLSHLLGYYFSKYLGLNPLIKSDPYRVVLQLPVYVNLSDVESIVKSAILSSSLENDFRDALRKSSMFKHVLVNVLKRMGVIPEKAPLNIINVLARKFEGNELIVKEVLNELSCRYVDFAVIKKLVERVNEGKAVVKFIEVTELSPLALEGLKTPGFSGRVLVKYIPRNVIAEMVKRRLLGKKVRLICMMCGYSYLSTVKELPDEVVCPKCGVRYVGVSRDLSDDVVKLVQKGLKVGKNYKFVLKDDEKEAFMRLKESAYLVLNYGKRAVIALVAYGIGPETAKKPLSLKSEEDFYNMVYELERKYISTRRFWD
ncbi:MAG: DEAD/DEAH box helicase [Sulfolobales archaeon]|nr:DEAD/DEAH box helicase [Sulfolobales archaeon]MCX8185747.1 DEAD/DEAH box helicase [Sulfolobales archaeon]